MRLFVTDQESEREFTRVIKRAMYILKEKADYEATGLLELCSSIKLTPETGRLTFSQGAEPVPEEDGRWFDILIWTFYVGCPGEVCEILSNKDHPVTLNIKDAFYEAACSSPLFDDVNMIQICPFRETESWNAQITNQGLAAKGDQAQVWKGLRLGSRAEVAIADALERSGALFFPNGAARLGSKSRRVTRYPDFLVCYGGQWGVLEVDGSYYHPPENRAAENERDRLFNRHGIFIVQHYDAQRCLNDPDGVVHEFFESLRLAR